MAKGILLYDRSDKKIQEYFIDSAQPKVGDFNQVIEVVRQAETAPNLTTIKRLTGLHPTRVMIVVAELLEQGFLKKFSNNGSQVYGSLENHMTPDLSRYTNQYEVKTVELRKMLQYGEMTSPCRMETLRSALGDQDAKQCGQCDLCQKSPLHLQCPPQKIAAINEWLSRRPQPISPIYATKTSAGLSVLDGKLRSPYFIHFMRQRGECPPGALGLPDGLIELVKIHLKTLVADKVIACIIVIPSRTWKARCEVAAMIGEYLGVPVMTDLLEWNVLPEKRQGELLNNDQRHHNVHTKMRLTQQPSAVTKGAILVLDDYIGSGNTFKEAARTLRANGLKNELIPFTIAGIKWHLGKPGFA